MSPRREKEAARAPNSVVIEGEAGPVEIPAGEWYINTKARARRRMILAGLSEAARKIDACLELHTMGYKSELAVKMVGGKQVHLTPADVINEAGISKRDFRRGMDELKAVGLGERRGADDGPLHKGKVELYSWGIPRETQASKKEAARAPFPAWFTFPKDSPLACLVNRLKLRLLPEIEGAARAPFLEKLQEAARRWEEGEKEVIALLKGVCAQRETAPIRERNERPTERKGTAAAAVLIPQPEPPPDPQPAARSREWLDRQRDRDAIAEEVLTLTQSMDPAFDAVYRALEPYCTVDDGRVLDMIAACRAVCSDAKDYELDHYIRKKGTDLRKRGNVRDMFSLLKKAVPEQLKGRSFALFRQQTEAAIERAEEARRANDELEARQAEADRRADEKIAAMGPEIFERLLKPKLAQAKKDYPMWTDAALRALAERNLRWELGEDDKTKGAES